MYQQRAQPAYRTVSAGRYQQTAPSSSAVWLPSGRCLTGTPDGAIAVWDSAARKCVRVVRAHAAGPSVTREDGPPTHHGVRCLRLRADNKTLLSAGLAGAWRERGHTVAPYKKGPDYIDGAWLSQAAEAPCRNLDLFLMTPPAIVNSFAHNL